MKFRNGFRIAIAVCALGGLALATGVGYTIESITFDKTSKKVVVKYKEIDTTTSHTATDSGPILLCVLNRLLKRKYAVPVNPSLPRDRAFTKSELQLLSQASALLPAAEATALRDAVRAYAARPDNGANVFKTLVSSMKTGLVKHETSFSTTTAEDSPLKKALKRGRAATEEKLEALSKTPEAIRSAAEKALIATYRREIANLSRQIDAQRPVIKKTERRVSPVDEPICVKDEETRAQTGINNTNFEELLRAVKLALDSLPKGAGIRRAGGH